MRYSVNAKYDLPSCSEDDSAAQILYETTDVSQSLPRVRYSVNEGWQVQYYSKAIYIEGKGPL